MRISKLIHVLMLLSDVNSLALKSSLYQPFKFRYVPQKATKLKSEA